MRFFLPIVFSLFLMSSCSAPNASIETLQKSGFTDIVITGYLPFSCENDDTLSTCFTARNAQGITVEGIVCCGTFKSCTVRF